MLPSKLIKHFKNRFSTDSKTPSSKEIRNKFLEYFIHENEHTFIKSSSVIPFGDPSLAFVNAGMNQFKSIFLGNSPITEKRVANSQKCIRIGGKHNDLDVVGTDSYHHTFFEMLGNWSFNDYFKLDACQMSYELITKVYGINKSQLYFTYFGGDNRFGLIPDNETKEIWRSLGISEDRILPFGMKDNFWEMGKSGPCGPCTEIHFDHIPGRTNAHSRVNQGVEDLTEIWNLVFIQYRRNLNNDLEKLNNYFVDTGMGFERLVAIIQKKNSNYATDLFLPLFKTIEKLTGAKPYEDLYGDNASLFQAYRIMADHIRMITISLADGILPDENHRLRGILRKILYINETMFKKTNGLLNELLYNVAESLGETYPEIWKNLDKVKLIIDHEEQLYNKATTSVKYNWEKIIVKNPKLKTINYTRFPSIVEGYKEMIRYIEYTNDKVFTGEFLYKLYTTFGLDQTTIEIIADANNMKADWEEYKKILRSNALMDKLPMNDYFKLINQLKSNSIPETDNSLKYSYYNTSDIYIFPSLRCRVLALIENRELVSSPSSNKFSIILDSSNLYYESGGQISDYGYLFKESNKCFQINNVENISNYILHHGELIEGEIKIGDILELKLDEERRLSNMRNHTATHLLNKILHNDFKLTYQKSSLVTDEYFTFDFAIYGEKFDIQNIIAIEEQFNKYIKMNCPVKRKLVNSDEFLKCDNIILLPGEIYSSENISLIEIDDQSQNSCEPCCGTHLFSTGHIKDFSILEFKNVSSIVKHIRAITGINASQAKHHANNYKKELENLKQIINENEEKAFLIYSDLSKTIINDNKLPYINKNQFLNELDIMKNHIQSLARKQLRSSIEDEITNLLNNKVKSEPLVYFLKSTSNVVTIPIRKIAKNFKNNPLLILAIEGEYIIGRTIVPEYLVNDDFNAQKWMKSIFPILKIKGSREGKNPNLIYYLNIYKGRVSDEMIEKALDIAKKFAEANLKKTT